MSEIIRQKIEAIHERDGWRCQFAECNKRSEEIAHRIAKSKANKKMIKNLLIEIDKKYLKVEDIVHHRFNLVACCKKHNDYFNIGFKPLEVTRLLYMIIEDLEK